MKQCCKVSFKIGTDTFDPSWGLLVDDNGAFNWGSAGLRAFLRLEIKEFLRLDAAEINGLAAAGWPPIMTAAFPIMKAWSVGDMKLAIALRCEKHRADGEDTLAC